MTFEEMMKLNKGEVCWYSFISGMAQYRKNMLDFIEVITIPDRYMLIVAQLTNSKNNRHVSWRYRFNLDEKIYAEEFIEKICNTFPYIKIIESERWV